MNRENKNRLSSKSNGCTSTLRYKCEICDEAAEHSNYGAICCSACKIFFRRNAMVSAYSRFFPSDLFTSRNNFDVIGITIVR